MTVRIDMANSLEPTFARGTIDEALQQFNAASSNGLSFVALIDEEDGETCGIHMRNVNKIKGVPSGAFSA